LIIIRGPGRPFSYLDGPGFKSKGKSNETKAQKQEELKRAKVLLDKSQALIFTDFTKIPAESIRKLRIDLKNSGANFLVIKKRLLGLLLKEKGSTPT